MGAVCAQRDKASTATHGISLIMATILDERRGGGCSRLSTMANESPGRVELLQGTLDMLVLRTLLFGPAHGHAIAKHIQRTTDEVLQVEHGSLYPALHRLTRQGWITSKWDTMPDRNPHATH